MFHYRCHLTQESSNARSAGMVETWSCAPAAQDRTTTSVSIETSKLGPEAKCSSIALSTSARTASRRLGMPAV